ncbi:MAG: LPS export ABC transporter periplasmic protein LptC [Luminiphilus sp.]|nr:LPS export ABC transporter periplasmic protein LptC [Luminiphilus sp.]
MKLTFSSLLLLATAAFFWVTIGQGDSVLPVSTDSSETWTESYLTNAERWSYDESGRRNQYLTIGSGITYHGDPATYLEELAFSGPDEKGRYWQMTANAGKLHPHSQELILMQGVQISERGGEANLDTPRLRLLLREERAVNQTRVRLTTPSSTTTARGIDIDLKSGRAELLNDVETVYVE